MDDDPTQTVLQSRRSRETGTLVEVIRRAAPDGRPGAIYETICWGTDGDAHNGVCEHDTRALALRFAPVPGEWCEECIAARRPGTVSVSYKPFSTERGQEVGEVIVIDHEVLDSDPAVLEATHETASGAVVTAIPVGEDDWPDGMRSMGHMTRRQAEAVAREHGVELHEH
jgi:hypothetical protein